MENKEIKITKENYFEHIGKRVWAMNEKEKTKSHARLLSYNELKKTFVLKCGVHNNMFECDNVKLLIEG